MLKSHYFRLFFLSFTLLFLLVTNSSAQNDKIKKENKPISFTSGSWSLQFRITRDFALSSFQGSTISAKRHFSDKSAIRFGISLSGHNSENEKNSNSINSENYYLGRKFDDNKQSIDVNTQIIYYPSLKKDVNLYFGIGPYIEYSRSKSKSSEEQMSADTLSTYYIIDRKINSWDFGISIILGVEYFLTKKLSFIAEYGSSLYCNWSKGENTRKWEFTDASENGVDKEEIKNNGYGLKASSVKFGLSVYF